ncbi:MAG TPA: threonylcarbamoyl-AMP synthase [Aeromonadales bacterium]|nr:threonylcarbamoyl-AMP synthase [Aeromonadales bacterium]
MAQFIQIHPQNPQPRYINQAVALLRKGGVIVYPTDSGYALGCHIGDKEALQRIRRIRELDIKHHFTLVCHDLSELGTYAIVNNSAYRLLKSHTPGPYTFILKATKEVPRRLQHPKRKTIGFRVPDNQIALDLLEAMGEPIMNTSLILPGESEMFLDAEEIREKLDKQVDLIIDAGFCGNEATTVIDLTGDSPELIREGAGSIEELL